MEQPLISVIVPVYKVEQYLERCVTSIINQTYKNLEILLVDDGSPDRCGEMCDEFAKKDSRIRVIHKENGGLSSARNAGLDIINGEYVGFVDSDDWIESEMYKSMLDLILEYKAQIVCCGIKKIDENGNKYLFNDNVNEFMIFNTQEALSELPFNTRITNSLCDKLFDRSVFNDVRMVEGIIYEDHEVMHRCIYCANKTIYTGQPYYNYSYNSDSITGGKANIKLYGFLPSGRARIDFYKKNSPQSLPIVKAKYIEFCLGLIYKTNSVSDCDFARQELIKEIKTMLKNDKNIPFCRNVKIKVIVFKIGVPLYILFIKIFNLLRKLK